jgi:hypothetical protein
VTDRALQLVTDRALQFGHDFFFLRLLLRSVVLRDVSVVARGSVGCSVVLIKRFSVVVMRGLGVVGRGSIHRRVEFRCLSYVVLWSLGVVN